MKSGKQKIYVPERGDIIRLNFSPHQGHEQGFERPAIILSPIQYNKLTSLALMCPITSEDSKYDGLTRTVEIYVIDGTIYNESKSG